MCLLPGSGTDVERWVTSTVEHRLRKQQGRWRPVTPGHKAGGTWGTDGKAVVIETTMAFPQVARACIDADVYLRQDKIDRPMRRL
jgi:hypothetical protein